MPGIKTSRPDRKIEALQVAVCATFFCAMPVALLYFSYFTKAQTNLIFTGEHAVLLHESYLAPITELQRRPVRYFSI